MLCAVIFFPGLVTIFSEGWMNEFFFLFFFSSCHLELDKLSLRVPAYVQIGQSWVRVWHLWHLLTNFHCLILPQSIVRFQPVLVTSFHVLFFFVWRGKCVHLHIFFNLCSDFSDICLRLRSYYVHM